MPAGYLLQSITCQESGPTGYTNTASTGNLDTATATVNLDSGETASCTFASAPPPPLQ